jgi:RNA polymerase sigma factor (TIGR02999 family)
MATSAESPPPAPDADGWIPLLYHELRRIARRERIRLFAGETLATTALINEAYARLAATTRFESPGHFLGTAAVAMRGLLVDHIRAQCAQKRGGGAADLPLDEVADIVVEDGEHVLEIHDALERLARKSPRLVKVVECRFFAGYDEAQTAEVTGTSIRSVQRDWATARAWLKKELGG